mmetsp:Transcript_7537/g.14928  ORF Transcript_7537/g.14928 Transcript_7537/m.14928 type:complete len:247 (-) Transcript_7537:884-1624(-)
MGFGGLRCSALADVDFGRDLKFSHRSRRGEGNFDQEAIFALVLELDGVRVGGIRLLGRSDRSFELGGLAGLEVVGGDSWVPREGRGRDHTGDGDVHIILRQSVPSTAEYEELKGFSAPDDVVVSGDTGEDVSAGELVVLGSEPVNAGRGWDLSIGNVFVVLVVDCEVARGITVSAHHQGSVGNAGELDPLTAFLPFDAVVARIAVGYRVVDNGLLRSVVVAKGPFLALIRILAVLNNRLTGVGADG